MKERGEKDAAAAAAVRRNQKLAGPINTSGPFIHLTREGWDR
jgi:hypothetical protein